MTNKLAQTDLSAQSKSPRYSFDHTCLKSSSAKLGKMTRHEFGEFCNVLVTTLVNFKMNDALVLQILESMHEVDTHFVARREDCICFMFRKGKCCGRCDSTVRSQIFFRLRNLDIFEIFRIYRIAVLGLKILNALYDLCESQTEFGLNGKNCST